MTIKEQLNELKDLAPLIRSLEDEPEQDRPLYAYFPDRLAEWEQKTLDSINHLKAKRQAVIDLINRLDDPLQRELLLVRYRDGVKWKELEKQFEKATVFCTEIIKCFS